MTLMLTNKDLLALIPSQFGRTTSRDSHSTMVLNPRDAKFKSIPALLLSQPAVPMLEIDEQAHLRNLTIVGGGAGTVGIGGYLTGGGHSALSSTYGLAADQVLENGDSGHLEEI